MDYSDPWREKENRKIAARQWIEHVSEQYASEIAQAIQNATLFFDKEDPLEKSSGILPPYMIVEQDSLSAARNCKGKTAILCFASYKRPGGMFLEGSIAQEEALCHESTLFPIINSDYIRNIYYRPNLKKLNRALYNDNLLYIPGVLFVDKQTKRAADAKREFDVIVCAAPNSGSAIKYYHVSNADCEQAMRNRIRAILTAAEIMKPSNVVLGAFGCGVFKNDPVIVASLFLDVLQGHTFSAVFATPGKEHSAFLDVFLRNNVRKPGGEKHEHLLQHTH